MSKSGKERRGRREVKLAWMLVAGTFVALILNGIWSLVVGTASFGGDEEDLVRGWEGVLRNSPAYLLLVIVPSLGMWFATRAITRGAEGGKSVLIASSLALLFALASVTRDAAEVVMTTRAATVSWVTFGVDVVLVGLLYGAARRRIRHASSR
ncbi:MAG: hypothetical protein RIS33_1421 [Actinomycetota bacterium]|jgi:hypothetical protein